WVLLSGSFIADSAYSHLTIGNFFVDSLTDTLFFPPTSHAYYYVDDISVVEDTETGNESLSKRDMILFPNPTSDILNLSFQNFRDAEVSIYDGLGRKVFSATAKNQNTLTLNLGAFSPGVYL